MKENMRKNQNHEAEENGFEYVFIKCVIKYSVSLRMEAVK